MVMIITLYYSTGLSLSHESLSLRPYIAHITLRSTTSYLMAKLCRLTPGDYILDPMCGGGTILAEAANSFRVRKCQEWVFLFLFYLFIYLFFFVIFLLKGLTVEPVVHQSKDV